jgi:hypothetical protein
MLPTGTFTSSERGSIYRLPIDTVPLSRLSKSGNSSAANLLAEYTEAPDSLTINILSKSVGSFWACNTFCNNSMVSLTPVPFQTTMVVRVYFFNIALRVKIDFSGFRRNILSKKIGFHPVSRIHILHPAANQGSIVRIVFPYSGRVMSREERLDLNDSIASSSQISLRFARSSFSTDLNIASYPFLKASSRISEKGVLTERLFA